MRLLRHQFYYQHRSSSYLSRQAALNGSKAGTLQDSLGQSFEDRLYALKYFLQGRGLSFVVLKATTTELMGPKRKHLNYLVSMTNEPNVSIPDLVKQLMRRARHPRWSVSFKALITMHYLMNYGNEKFIQNLASSVENNRALERITSFEDRDSVLAYNMSVFIRRYARYLSVKLQTYRALGIDFCLTALNGNALRDLTAKASGDCTSIGLSGEANIVALPTSKNTSKENQLDETLKTLRALLNQFDALMAFDASANDLKNGIIDTAFSMLYKDFVKIYIFYQGFINKLLGLYFSVNQVKRVYELYDLYRKFLTRMEQVSDLMRVLNEVGMSTRDMPELNRTPSLSIQDLDKHLRMLESANRRQAVGDSATMTRQKSVEPPPKIELYASLSRRRSSRDNLNLAPIENTAFQRLPNKRRATESARITEKEDSDDSNDKQQKQHQVSEMKNNRPNATGESAKLEATHEEKEEDLMLLDDFDNHCDQTELDLTKPTVREEALQSQASTSGDLMLLDDNEDNDNL